MFSGVTFGIWVWGAYAVAEAACWVLWPLVAGYADLILPVQWAFLGVTGAAYLAAGVVSGVLAEWVRRSLRVSRRRATARLALAMLAGAYIANLIVRRNGWNSGDTVALVLAVLVFTGAIAGLFGPRWATVTRPLADPWTAALLLTAGPLTAPAFRPLSVLAVGALAATAFAISHLILDRGPAIKDLPVRQARALAGAVAVLLGSTPALTEELELPSATANMAVRESRPNIVLVVLDTVRADHLSVYGYQRPTSPWLERFAARATLFRHCFAPSNYTLASHASLFTGLYPRGHGATNLPPGESFGEPLNTRTETMAERLARHGYFNFAVAANFVYLGRDFGLHQGFHVYDARRPVLHLKAAEHHHLRNAVHDLLRLLGLGNRIDRCFRDAGEVNETLFRLLEEIAPARSPFFLFVNYVDAHAPYIAPSPYDDLFDLDDPRYDRQDYNQWMRAALSGKPGSVAVRDHYTARYDESIRYVDAEVGRLIDKLSELGEFDNTMIIITADHGDAFGEHAYVGHGWSLYQEEVWVPLLIKYPRQVTGQVVNSNVSLVDLMPTALDVAGIEPPEKLHGISLMSMRDGEASRLIFSEAYLSAHRTTKYRVEPFAAWAVISPQRLKMIRTSDGRTELYDLNRDPGEMRDLHSERSTDAGRLAQALEEWQALYPLGRTTARPADARKLERLRALGYVQ